MHGFLEKNERESRFAVVTWDMYVQMHLGYLYVQIGYTWPGLFRIHLGSTDEVTKLVSVCSREMMSVTVC